MLSQAVSQKRHPQGVKGSLFCELVANLMDVETAKKLSEEWSSRERPLPLALRSRGEVLNIQPLAWHYTPHPVDEVLRNFPVGIESVREDLTN